MNDPADEPAADPAKAPPADPAAPLLEVRGLAVRFRSGRDEVRAVNGVSFDVRAGETLAIVGESGSGKSITSLSILRLLPGRRAALSGSIRFLGEELTTASEARMRALRGDEISMIFQEPMTSLDPVMTVGRQIAEAIEVHQGLGREAAMQAAVTALDDVRVPEPARRAKQYPFQLSGGLRQRVMIAMAMSCRPKLLIADEPTTALDVTIQAQILNLMDELRERTGAAVVLITHDLGVVAEMADRVAVMYAGQVVERAPVGALFAAPRHPYTAGLLGALPRVGAPGQRLREIRGTVPSLRAEIRGCAFAPRCPLATERCRAEAPPLEARAPGHDAACWESARLAETADA